MDAYHCAWCGWNGHAVGQQIAELLARIPGGGGLLDSIRYACYICGDEVRPGKHRANRGINE